MNTDEFIGCFFAVCSVIVLVWVIHSFIFGVQEEYLIINTSLSYGDGNLYIINETPTCELLVGVDNEPQDGGAAICTFGGEEASLIQHEL
jgi:hypothetical protein